MAEEPWTLPKNFLFLSPLLSELGNVVKGEECGKAYLGVLRKGLYNYLTAFRSELPLGERNEAFKEVALLGSIMAKSGISSLIYSGNVWHTMSSAHLAFERKTKKKLVYLKRV